MGPATLMSGRLCPASSSPLLSPEHALQHPSKDPPLLYEGQLRLGERSLQKQTNDNCRFIPKATECLLKKRKENTAMPLYHKAGTKKAKGDCHEMFLFVAEALMGNRRPWARGM
eukprot:1150255-Pelagomonas_calceolata.AAC.3